MHDDVYIQVLYKYVKEKEEKGKKKCSIIKINIEIFDTGRNNASNVRIVSENDCKQVTIVIAAG